MSTTTTSRNRALEQNRSGRGERLLRAMRTPSGAVFVLLLVLLIAVIAVNPNFGEPGSLIRFIGRTAPIAIAAMGQYFVIVCGEFDLSMGSLVTAQVIIAGNLIGQDDSRVVPVLILMLVFGAFVGLVNGLLTTLLKVPSFIVTLGMMLALLGMVLYWTGGAATGNPADSFRQIGRGGIQDIPILEILPYPVIILVVLGAGAFWLMRRPYGRTLIAVGDNADAAALTGARVWWIRTRAFMLSSLAATVAGIILVGYAGVHPSVGRGYEFTAITAVVLGGVVLGGGRGWVLSAAAGAFALEMLFTLLNFMGIQSTWRDTVQGIIIILAVAAGAQSWQRRRRGRSSATHEPSHPITTTDAPTPAVGTNEGGK